MLLLWRLTVRTYPSEPAEFSVQISQMCRGNEKNLIALRRCREIILESITKNLEGDYRFQQHLTYPQVTWDWNMPLELTMPGGGLPRTTEIQPVSFPQHPGMIDLTDSPRPRPALQIVRAEQPTATESKLLAEIEQLKRQMLAFSGGAAPVAVSEEGGLALLAPGVLAPNEVATPQLQRTNAFGDLPIEGGFAQSPGADLAQSAGSGSNVGVVAAAGAAMVERVELGMTHPALPEGGAGTPDGLRRENGLPIPGTQASKVVRGGIVDIPADTF